MPGRFLHVARASPSRGAVRVAARAVARASSSRGAVSAAAQNRRPCFFIAVSRQCCCSNRRPCFFFAGSRRCCCSDRRYWITAAWTSQTHSSSSSNCCVASTYFCCYYFTRSTLLQLLGGCVNELDWSEEKKCTGQPDREEDDERKIAAGKTAARRPSAR